MTKDCARHEAACADANAQLSAARSQLASLQREFDDQELSLGRLEQRLEQQLGTRAGSFRDEMRATCPLPLDFLQHDQTAIWSVSAMFCV